MTTKPSFQRSFIIDLTFPNDEALPSKGLRRREQTSIPFLVSLKLRQPKVGPRLRHFEDRASLVCMPEASVNEDRFSA